MPQMYTERKKKRISLFEMLNIHICTHCDTFFAKIPRVCRMLMVKAIWGAKGKSQPY